MRGMGLGGLLATIVLLLIYPAQAGSRQRAFELNARLDGGISLGNALDAFYEGEWGLLLRSEHFDSIQKAGFRSVRIPIRWSSHAQSAPPYTIDSRFLARVDWVIDQALRHELMVIIDTHNDDLLYKAPVTQTDRFLSYWKQVALRYRTKPDSVLFEVLNEPHGNLTSKAWNQLLAQALVVIRETNPKRLVVVGPAEWNVYDQLDNLEIPEQDDNLIVTFHYYDPGPFTHQGAPWVPGSGAWLGTTWGTPNEHKALEADFARVKEWSVGRDRPILLGEFGTHDKGDQHSRVAWTRAVSSQAKLQGFSRMYWEFATSFGLYDTKYNRWHQDLLDALQADFPQ